MDLQIAMVSSTKKDLSEHRKKVHEAIIEQKMFPKMMEYLPSSWNNAKEESLKMVIESDIFILILGFRYGDIWEEEDISLTEMEYNLAQRLHKKILVFIANTEHPFQIEVIDRSQNKINKLDLFRKKVSDSSLNVVSFFNSSDDLKSKVLNSLSHYHLKENKKIFFLPKPPLPYIPHPYTLLESKKLVGRIYEKNILDKWYLNKDEFNKPILSFISIGGMGKSALTWSWFTHKIDKKDNNYDGYIWWSFYENDSSFSNFVLHALAYIVGEDIERLSEMEAKKREESLLLLLKEKRYLIVFDGIERILIAYSRLDAAKLSEEGLDEKTNNILHPFYTDKNPKHGDSRLRRFSDTRATLFFNKLFSGKLKSKILISSRLLPVVLENPNFGEYNENSIAIPLTGLRNADALILWRKYNVGGNDKTLLTLFKTFNNYPLLIRALASEIKNFRLAPGDYYEWLKHNQNFNPFALDLVQVKSHVLYYALRGMDDITFYTLRTICAFRSPVNYDILVNLIVQNKRKISQTELISILEELEDRGLIGWNRKFNTYDTHPIVRGITWNFTKNDEKTSIFSSMTSLFKEMPLTKNWENIISIEDLVIPIEYFNALIHLKKYDEAFDIFYDKLNYATNYKLNANNLRINLLESFFNNAGSENSIRNKRFSFSFITNSLATSYESAGLLHKAVKKFELLIDFQHYHLPDSLTNLSISYINYSEALINLGELYFAELYLRKAVKIFQKSNVDYEAIAIGKLAHVLYLKGDLHNSFKAYSRSFELFERGTYSHPLVTINSNYIKLLLDSGREVKKQILKNKKLLSIYNNYERHILTSTRVYAEYLIMNNQLSEAIDILDKILIDARKFQYIEEELKIILILAKLSLNSKESLVFEEYYKDYIIIAKKGNYCVALADMYCQISVYYSEIDISKAISFAAKAVECSTKNGLNFAYQYGLNFAFKLLKKYKFEIQEIKQKNYKMPNELKSISLKMPR